MAEINEGSYVAKDGKQYSYTSLNNFAVRLFMVKREVYGEMTDFINFMLDSPSAKAPVTWEHLLSGEDQFTRCPYCGGKMSYTVLDAEDIPVIPLGNGRFACPACESEYLSDAEARACCAGTELLVCEECGEVAEDWECDDTSTDLSWWHVSSWIGNHLADLGEIILKSDDGNYFWGISSENDDLVRNPAIGLICEDVKILEGQEHYREVKN